MDESQPIHGAEEIRLLELLKELQHILGDALNSLGGTTPPSAEANYLSWAAVSLNHAAGGYLWLRESGRVHASKLLVRPALESTFSGIAAIKDPEFLFRKAYSELEEDKKLFPIDAAGKKAAAEAVEKLERAFKMHCPNDPIVRKTISAFEAARVAGLQEVYEGAYRVYCQFTHGALRAATGELDEATDAADTRTVVWCLLRMLEHLRNHTPAQIPDLAGSIKALADIK